MSKYFEVINRAHRSLNKIRSIFLFNNDNFQNERPDSKVAILEFPGAWHWDVVSIWGGVGARPPSFPITTLHCEGIVLIPALTLSSACSPYKQSPLNLSLRPKGGSHQGHDPHRGGTRVVLDVARVHSGREVWASWVPGVWSKEGAAVWIDMSCWPYRLFTLQGASGLKKGHWWGALKCMI